MGINHHLVVFLVSQTKRIHCVQGFLLYSLIIRTVRYRIVLEQQANRITGTRNTQALEIRAVSQGIQPRIISEKATWRGPKIPGPSPELWSLSDSQSRRHSLGYQSPGHFPLYPKPTKRNRKDSLLSLGFSLFP